MTNDRHNDLRQKQTSALERALPTIARASVLAFALLLAAGCASAAHADGRADFLVRLLETSDQFRVRVQAALALSQAAVSDVGVTEALVRALRDEHPAVRAAAAWSLQARGDPSVLYALRAGETDHDPGVASAATRAVIALERIAEVPRATAAFHGLR